jgi:hypothetical protein
VKVSPVFVCMHIHTWSSLFLMNHEFWLFIASWNAIYIINRSTNIF